MPTEHIKYDLMDYITNRLNVQECRRVEEHLLKCAECNTQYIELLATNAILKSNHETAPATVYYSTILPRVRERIVSRRRSIWKYGYRAAKIILPLTVSVILVIILLRTPKEPLSDAEQSEALHQVVMDLNEEEVMQAVETEYAGSSLTPNQEVAAAGVAEHMQGDRFLKSAVSKQIESEEIAEVEVEGMVSDLDGDQVEQVLSGLSERNTL